jgi:Cysteine sulfinate desulfinase/cysteine desulfurase and related enzymes
MLANLDINGNASSMYTSGRLARRKIENARKLVGELIGASASEILFTSGGSEANNMVLRSIQKTTGRDARVIVSSIEHPSVLNTAEDMGLQGADVIYLPVDKSGKIKMKSLECALEKGAALISVMLANNETGTIQDIKEVVRLAKQAGVSVHTDAVQAIGKIPIDVEHLGADYLTISAHKIYGPKGVGALFVRGGAKISPLILGGHQEGGLRAGTYNCLGITGFGQAAEAAVKNIAEYGHKTRDLRDRLKNGIMQNVPKSILNGHELDSLPNTLNMSFPGAEGESILLALDHEGIEVSTGSACASDDLAPSHVLMAMGKDPELAHGSIRFSLGYDNTEDEIDYVIKVLPPIVAKLRAMSTVGY